MYIQTYTRKRTLVGNRIVDHSDVVGSTRALLQLHFHSPFDSWLQWTQLQAKTRNVYVLGFGATWPYIFHSTVINHLKDN